MEKIKVLQIGCGKMSIYTMRYIFEHGAKVVGAVDINSNLFGKDIGEIANTDNKNVLIRPLKDLPNIIEETKPHIAIVETMSLINDIKDVLRTCASMGVNVITTCEEAFFPANSNPNVWKEIDVLAKANKCTVTGSGYQDVFWGNLISVLAGTTNKITKIKGSSSYNVEDYGIALANAHGAGLSLDDFNHEIASQDDITPEERNHLIEQGTFLPSYMWNTVGWLADDFGLHITSMTQKCVPMTNEKDVNSTTLGMVVKAGDATGMSAVVTATTEEGIILEAECIGKVYDETEFDKNEWTIYGEPDTTVIVNRPATVELTCADIVNRLPNVIKAEPGFVPTTKMGTPRFKKDSLDTYL